MEYSTFDQSKEINSAPDEYSKLWRGSGGLSRAVKETHPLQMKILEKRINVFYESNFDDKKVIAIK